MFTDFGANGPYLGQMEAVIYQHNPQCNIINLLSDAPTEDIPACALLLQRLSTRFPENSVFLSVVDPGVGGERLPIVLKADHQFFVGPDNGLFDGVATRARAVEWYEINFRLDACSRSFHGRDIFAPVAAMLTQGTADNYLTHINRPAMSPLAALNRIIYFDTYGNAFTGIPYQTHFEGTIIKLGDSSIPQANTFCDVPQGDVFWYKNSLDLIEIAANQASARHLLGLRLGQDVVVQKLK